MRVVRENCLLSIYFDSGHDALISGLFSLGGLGNYIMIYCKSFLVTDVRFNDTTTFVYTSDVGMVH